MTKIVEIEDLNTELQFQVRLQISLINYAKRVIPEYPDKKTKFEKYIEERNEVIKKLLNVNEKFQIMYKKEKIY